MQTHEISLSKLLGDLISEHHKGDWKVVKHVSKLAVYNIAVQELPS